MDSYELPRDYEHICRNCGCFKGAHDNDDGDLICPRPGTRFERSTRDEFDEAWANFKAEIVRALHVRQAVEWLAGVLPAPGFFDRLRSHAILFSHPNYWKLRKDMRSIWRGR